MESGGKFWVSTDMSMQKTGAAKWGLGGFTLGTFFEAIPFKTTVI